MSGDGAIQDIQVIERESIAIRSRRDRILALKATDEASFAELAAALKEGKRYIRWVDEEFDPDAAFKAWKVAVERKKMMRKPGEELVAHANTEVVSYLDKQEQKRREAEAAAERERLRLEAEARLAAGVEAARLRKEAEDRIVEAAAVAEANGDLETAERILAEPVVVLPVAPAVVFTPPVMTPKPTLGDGQSSSQRWKGRVTNLPALITAIATGRASPSLVKADEVAINQLARATRGPSQIPGVVFEPETTVTTRLG